MKMVKTRLKELRECNGLTQCQLAKALHVSQSTYSAYETGKTDPSVHIMIAAAQFYETTVDYLLYLSNVRTRKPPE